MKKNRIHFLDTMYLRGRNIPNAIWDVDDAQNLSISQMKTLGTRTGEDCKLILNGDPGQSDIKGESAITNSLVFANEKFKGYDNSATIWFPDSCCVRARVTSQFNDAFK